jgi:hypothetical protein
LRAFDSVNKRRFEPFQKINRLHFDLSIVRSNILTICLIGANEASNRQ